MVEDNKKVKQILEEGLSRFWKDYGKILSVKGIHTQIKVKPIFLIGNNVNPEVAKRLMLIYLMQLTADRVIAGEVKVDSEGLKIFDGNKQVMLVKDIQTIDNMKNKMTCSLGRELAKRQSKAGTQYMEHNESGVYAFGEIKQALVDFLYDEGKHESKNLLKEALLLLTATPK